MATGTGVAVFTYEMPGYDEGTQTHPTPVTDNVETFKAVYLENATYAKSSAEGAKAYIKSAKLQTPVIESELPGVLHTDDTTVPAAPAGDKCNTYYDYDLVNLLAGVKHTFTLRQTGAAETTDEQYSVVALDGRTVDAGDYDIQWIVKTGDNEETNAATGASFSTSNNKDGDYIYVKLIGKNNMTNEAASRLAVIGKLQGVVVTVEAIDAITKTPVDRNNGKYPDVYQLNEIELTAKVAAAEGSNSTMQPTGKVAFYYR